VSLSLLWFQFFTSAIALVETHELRAYDGVQLAAAVELNRVCTSGGLLPATVVSADLDLDLNSAAQAGGLAVEDPNSHP
jgi:hypothetical protein